MLKLRKRETGIILAVFFQYGNLRISTELLQDALLGSLNGEIVFAYLSILASDKNKNVSFHFHMFIFHIVSI